MLAMLNNVYLLVMVHSLSNLSIHIEKYKFCPTTQLEHLGTDLLAVCTSARHFFGLKSTVGIY